MQTNVAKKVVVEFTGIKPGKCRWCRKDKDRVISLAFSDGSFVGSYCQADFMKALEDKLEFEPETPAKKAEPKSQGNGIPTAELAQ